MLAELLLLAARDAADRGVGYCTSDAVTRVGYPQLLDQSLRLLAGLRALGAEPGRTVALLLQRPEEFLPALWACLLGGLTVCPLVPIREDEPRWAAQLTHVNTLLDGPLLLTSEQLLAELPAVAGLAVATVDEASRHGVDISAAEVAIHPSHRDDAALLVLTSGSTGNAKAVVLTHANLLASMAAKAEVQRLTGEDVTLNWVSFDHVAALLETHLLPLSVGAAQFHTTADSVLAEPARFLRLVDTHRVTMTFTPNFLLGLLSRTPLQQFTGLDLSSLKKIISGGEANPVATGRAFLDRLAPFGLAPDALWPAFGMTETCAGSIYNRTFPEGDAGAEFAAVGRPVTGLRIRVAGADGGGPEGVLALPEGEVGEVQLHGPMVTGGYHNDPAATAAAFTPDGWFRTGDLGRLHEGRLTLVGRSKDSVIVNGVTYYSHDLESVLEQLDGVERSYVAAFPTRPAGSDTEQLAVLLATDPPQQDEAALHRLLIAVRNSVVLHWGFRPAVVLPLPREEFAKTSLGKIQRSLLRRRLEAGEFGRERARVEELVTRQLGGLVVPAEGTEQALAELYAEIFDTPAGGISATASFFDLGGTSLDILRLKSLIGARFDVELPVLAILRAPSVRALAGQLATAASRGAGVPEPYDPIVTLQSGGERTPLFCVHPGVGEVLVFVNLAKYFVHERPFHALRARGFNPGEKPFESFEEMARCYAQAIRAVQPHGPYALAGYSFGAAVAFEVAKLLEEQGERVDFLGSFNLPPHIKYRMNELDYVETAVNLAMFLELVSKQQAEELPDQLRPFPREEQLARLLALAPAHRLAQLDLDLERFGAWADLADGLTDLGRGYQPSGTVRSMSVFYAVPLRGTKEEWLARELRRWDEHTSEPNRYLDVPGEHYTLMGPRHVAAFQSILRAELDRALDGN
ncbi:non-ribosomal peptide synthetase [Kitasatospora nipponensis]|uniref:Non-ribosomal peptide synthetase n=2 Tax=Kitasatospora nipponensis TaxID=258049 RepID=A0ABP4GLV5_9ACTN